jgi:hypothetical protein
LDQVSARVVENGGGHGTHRGGVLRELDTECPEPLELLLQSSTAKEVNGIPSLTSAAEGLGGGVRVGFEHQLGPVRVVRRDDREPTVLAERDLGLLLEAEDIGVEVEHLVLVVDEDTG